MKEENHFPEIPINYALCLKRECPKASTCLRQLAEQAISDSVERWTIISPKYQANLEGECPHYRSDVKVIYAKGFKHILDSLPYAQMKTVISRLRSLFSERTYYRVRCGERLLSPEEQKEIQRILLQSGITEPPKFDAYVEDYAWW